MPMVRKIQAASVQGRTHRAQAASTRPPISAAIPAPPEREIVRVEIKDPSALALLDQTGDVRPLEQVEGDTIRFALEHYRGQMSKVARKLGIGRSTLYRKLKDLGIEADEGESDGQDEARVA